MFKGWQAAVREALDTKDHVSKAVDPHDKSIASHAVQRNVDPNSSALTDAFKKLYGDAGMSGTKHAMDEMGGAAKLGSGMSGLVGGMDWSKWKPGNPVAAEKVAGKDLNELMRNAGVTVRGIEQTTLNRMGDVIAQGLEAGSTYQEISGNISTMLDNPARADIIAITETNRAFNASAIDEYKASGMEGWEWLAYAGACDICGDEEGPHDFGDDYPPAHPSCRCAVVVQLPDGLEAELGGEEDEVTAEDIAALEESTPTEETVSEEASVEEASSLVETLLENALIDAAQNIIADIPELEKFYSGVEHTIENAASLVNPKYTGESRSPYTTNCSRVVQNYELRRRGFDVVANKRDRITQREEDFIHKTWQTNASTVRKLPTVLHGGNRADALMKALETQYPEGSRGFVSVEWWDNGGHAINWEIKDGKAILIDAQQSHVGVENFTYNFSENAKEIKYLRVDDLQPTKFILNYIQGGVK
jgi:SPP1 gp7 family putative phage head morphogenesis protein